PRGVIGSPMGKTLMVELQGFTDIAYALVENGTVVSFSVLDNPIYIYVTEFSYPCFNNLIKSPTVIGYFELVDERSLKRCCADFYDLVLLYYSTVYPLVVCLVGRDSILIPGPVHIRPCRSIINVPIIALGVRRNHIGPDHSWFLWNITDRIS